MSRRKPYTAEIVLRARVPKGMSAAHFRHLIWDGNIAPQVLELDHYAVERFGVETLTLRLGPARIIRKKEPKA